MMFNIFEKLYESVNTIDSRLNSIMCVNVVNGFDIFDCFGTEYTFTTSRTIVMI